LEKIKLENKSDYRKLRKAAYHRQFVNALEELGKNNSTDNLRKVIHSGVKLFPDFYESCKEDSEGILDYDSAKSLFQLSSYIHDVIAEITPRILTIIFPVTKSYDGEKYKWKDYFYTMKELNRIGMDNVIGKNNVKALLFDYQNEHVINFGVSTLCLISDLRRHQGQAGLMEEFMAEHDVTAFRMMSDENGKDFFYDPVKQTTHRVAKNYPRYLRIIK